MVKKSDYVVTKSVYTSGVMVVNGARSKKEAEEIAKQLDTDGGDETKIVMVTDLVAYRAKGVK